MVTETDENIGRVTTASTRRHDSMRILLSNVRRAVLKYRRSDNTTEDGTSVTRGFKCDFQRVDKVWDCKFSCKARVERI
jgi:hypothetical protein